MNQSELNMINQLLPFLIPMVAIQLGLTIAALVHILTHQHYRTGSRVIWVIVCLLLNILGPVLYFIFGRSDEGGAKGNQNNNQSADDGKHTNQGSDL